MRNKRIADLSVGVLITLVIIMTFIKMNFVNNEWFEMFSFVIEAALVGAIADWFAITALFEEPFLIRRIPVIASHTAIISKNRKSIVDAVANMVQNELLSKKVLRSKIEGINIADSLISFVDNNIRTKSELYEKLIHYFIEKMGSVDTLEFAKFLETHMKRKSETMDISHYIYEGITQGMQRSEFKEILNIILDSVIEYVNRDSTRNIIEGVANDILKKEANSIVMEKIIGILKSVNAINTSDITISILKQSNKLLLNLKNEDDLLRLEIIDRIKQFFEKINSDNIVKTDIEKWKIKIIKEISLQDYLNEIIKNIIKVITEKETYLCNIQIDDCKKSETNLLSTQDITSIIAWIKTQLENSWNNLKDDHVNKENIDEFLKESVFNFIESKYQNIGQIVKQVLNNMNDEALNNFVKQKAGNELHGIRLNGCIVGALFGGFVFIITHLIYNLILPNIFNLNF